MACPGDRHDSPYEYEEDLFGEVELSSTQTIPRPEPASGPTTALHQPQTHPSISSAPRPTSADGLALPPLRAHRPTTSPTAAQAPCAGPSAPQPAGSLALPPLSASRPTTSPSVAQTSSASAISDSRAVASPAKRSPKTNASKPKPSESRKRSRDQVDNEGEQAQLGRRKAPRKMSRRTPEKQEEKEEEKEKEKEEGAQAGPSGPCIPPPPPGYSSWASYESATRTKSDPLKAQQEALWAENERQAELQGKSYAGPFLEAAEEKRRKKREAQRASRQRAKEGRSSP